mmetsp:Transcript_995/g.1905  ORF Transcript_995/g.1905 Transcript_995/m.1905 type:complete len:219 (+) Transcript_995:35-691(+)|eukprot:CAMPEP_0181306832 /NCGR_PEP_ID=MMETSP1101-20121128/10529_1 /TAXON_ID=46948 /ORGANISM="Rhodomonas abbreviata, Strain Caron Lab Isolate" /LENGTH=218 /DNA_ID=CAMNT_0023412953 /DNA_START=118 /DNA_END=774 /DNA_ORIENTATION=+
MQQATSMDDVQNKLQQKARDEAQAASDGGAKGQDSGIFVAPGVRFSDKLWSRLGGKMREVEKQKRRERMTDTTAFPEIPTSIFDSTYRRDAVWKQRELRLRKAYVEHLENLTLKKDDEKEALQEKILQQVTGVYKLAEDEAIERLAAHTDQVQARSFRPKQAQPACVLEKDAVMQCYSGNAQNPLVCAAMVSALSQCADRAREAAMRTRTPPSATQAS